MLWSRHLGRRRRHLLYTTQAPETRRSTGPKPHRCSYPRSPLRSTCAMLFMRTSDPPMTLCERRVGFVLPMHAPRDEAPFLVAHNKSFVRLPTDCLTTHTSYKAVVLPLNLCSQEYDQVFCVSCVRIYTILVVKVHRVAYCRYTTLLYIRYGLNTCRRDSVKSGTLSNTCTRKHAHIVVKHTCLLACG